MEDPCLLAGARQVELNPVRARLVVHRGDWSWSSARAYLSGRDDCLVKVAPLLAMIGDWNAFLDSAVPEEGLKELRHSSRPGRPLGNESFVERLEAMVGRVLTPQKRSPKPGQEGD